MITGVIAMAHSNPPFASTLPRAPCVLVVEDEIILVMMVEDLLLASGYHVVTAGRVRPALKAIEDRDVDLAILDLTLDGESCLPLAEQLRERGVPILFATGSDAGQVPGHYRHCPVLQKPYRPSELLDAVAGALPAR